MFIQPMHAREETLIIAPNGDVISVIMTEHRSSRDEPLVGLNTPENYMILRGRYHAKLQAFLDSTRFYQLNSDNQVKEVIAAHSAGEALWLYQQRYPTSCQHQLQPLDEIVGLSCYGRIVQSWFRRVPLPFAVAAVA